MVLCAFVDVSSNVERHPNVLLVFLQAKQPTMVRANPTNITVYSGGSAMCVVACPCMMCCIPSDTRPSCNPQEHLLPHTPPAAAPARISMPPAASASVPVGAPPSTVNPTVVTVAAQPVTQTHAPPAKPVAPPRRASSSSVQGAPPVANNSAGVDGAGNMVQGALADATTAVSAARQNVSSAVTEATGNVKRFFGRN